MNEDNIYSPNNTSFPSVSDAGITSSDAGRVIPRQLFTGSLKGTLQAGPNVQINSSTSQINIGHITLDGTNNIISTANSDSSKQGMGAIPNSKSYGLFSTATNGSVVWQQTGPTGYIYDLVNKVNVLQQGLLPDGSYGFKTTAPGVDVNTATATQYTLNSELDQLKVIKIIPLTVTVTVSGGAKLGNNTSSAYHGLTYAPGHIAFIVVAPSINDVGTYYSNPAIVSNATVGTQIAIQCMAKVTVDASQVYLKAEVGLQPDGTYNFSAKVYLLQEGAS